MAKKKVILVEGTESRQVTVEHSAKGKLTTHDFLKALLMAGIMAALMAVYKFFTEDGDLFSAATLAQIGKAAIGGMVGYLLKNLSTDTKIMKVEDNK